ncbi:hypothetical protein Tco_1476012 [Tanacetum coccineum]
MSSYFLVDILAVLPLLPQVRESTLNYSCDLANYTEDARCKILEYEKLVEMKLIKNSVDEDGVLFVAKGRLLIWVKGLFVVETGCYRCEKSREEPVKTNIVAIKMRVFMQAQGVWDAVEPKTSNTVVEVKKDKMALAAIYQGIPEDLLLSLAEKKIAKEAEFESLNMKESEGVDEFAVKVSNIPSTMRTLGDTVDEAYVVKELLRTVPSKFLQIASTLEQFEDLDTMTVEEVIGRLKAHEERMKGNGDNEDRRLLLTYQEWSERNKKKTEETLNLNRIEEGLEAYVDEAEEEVEVMVVVGLVEEEDHTTIKMEGVALQIIKIRAGFNATTVRNMVTMQRTSFDNGGEVGKVFLNEENVFPELRTRGDKVRQSSIWYLDTGASNHMTGDKDMFRDLNETVQGSVKFGNESKVRIEGKGSIVFQCKNGEYRKLDEVYYIPDLCSNIISLGQLAEGGDEIKIKEPFLLVHDAAGKLVKPFIFIK